MKKTSVLLALAALGFAGHALAQQSPWLVRARAVHLNMADKSEAIPALGVGADQITVNNKTIPEVDITYFVTPNIAAELVLTIPQKQTVSIAGTDVGTFKHLPPTLTVQYHFSPAAQVSPYLGAGVNYTRISSVKLLGGAGDLENQSFGLAVQAGVDYKLDKNWSLNLDLKKVQIRSDVFAGGSKVSAVKLDPWLLGVGVGYRF
ncbi:OmpW/AlkL family protein [Ramlibacter sp. MAHUQ-53]|uniref:OmpW/AlkL family protein n=1 Tax=unclassified Ramlibacter TaxID=2617605 RepID=UPI003624BDD0